MTSSPDQPGHPRRVTVTVPVWVAALRDPGVQAAIVLAVLAVTGFVMLGLAWRGGARTVWVPLQLPWLLSGGVAGLGLLGVALASLHVHLSRRDDAVHRAAMETFMRDAVELAEDLRTDRRRLPHRPPGR